MVTFNDKLLNDLTKSIFSYTEHCFDDFEKFINDNIDVCFMTEPSMISSKRNRLVNPAHGSPIMGLLTLSTTINFYIELGQNKLKLKVI